MIQETVTDYQLLLLLAGLSQGSSDLLNPIRRLIADKGRSKRGNKRKDGMKEIKKKWIKHSNEKQSIRYHISGYFQGTKFSCFTQNLNDPRGHKKSIAWQHFCGNNFSTLKITQYMVIHGSIQKRCQP